MHDSRYDPLQVSLPIFEGPLDLLLHLVKKQEMDISELRLSELTEPYLAYVEQLSELDLDQGGEFLVIAAMLIWIKSRSLLPRDPSEDEEELDPETLEEMLLLRLQEYQRFKDVSVELTDRDLLGRDIFPRQAPSEEEVQQEPDQLFEEVSLFNLLEAFRHALDRVKNVRELNILPDRFRVEDKVAGMLKRLSDRRPVYLHEFFEEALDRPEIIMSFIAMLEMVRLKVIRISQSGSNQPILCTPTDSFLEGEGDIVRSVMVNLFGEKGGEFEMPEDAIVH